MQRQNQCSEVTFNEFMDDGCFVLIKKKVQPEQLHVLAAPGFCVHS